MMPQICYELDWSDKKKHLGKTRVVKSIDLRKIGSPLNLGLQRLINRIRQEHPKVTGIKLQIFCIIDELKES